MYHIHIVYHEKDARSAFLLFCRLKKYYLLNRKLERAVITLEKNNSDITFSRDHYLIVICSLHTAQDAAIESDIIHFMEQASPEHIVPYVIGGHPYAKDADNECMPGILRELLKNDLLAVNSIELGRRSASNKVISAVHNISFEALEHRRKRQQIRHGILTVLTVLLLICFFCYVSYSEYTTTARTEYYKSYKYVYGEPVGVERMSQAEVFFCEDYYIFRINHHRTLSVQCVGDPPSVTSEIPEVQEYYDAIDSPAIYLSYHTDERLDAAVHTDEEGNILWVINYLADGNVADFSEYPDAYTPEFPVSAEENEKYARCQFVYDETGELSGVQYLENSRGVKSDDTDFIYSLEF